MPQIKCCKNCSLLVH